MNNGKEIYRKEILKLRDSILKREVNEKSKIIINKVYQLQEYKNSNVIMCYVDFRNEVRTENFIRKSLHLGKKVAVPRMISYDNENYMKAIFIDNIVNDLKRNNFGILEPKPYLEDEASRCNIDLAIIPGIVFDTNLNRIGFGKGYYDKFFSSDENRVFKLGICYDFQLKDKICFNENDISMDMIITEKRTIKSEQSG